MGQVELNLDLLIAISVQREPLDIDMDPNGPFNWHQAMLLGTVDLCQAPQQKKGQVGQALLRPLREQHEHIVAAKLPKHIQKGLLACSNIEETTLGFLQWHAIPWRQALVCKPGYLEWDLHVCH